MVVRQRAFRPTCAPGHRATVSFFSSLRTKAIESSRFICPVYLFLYAYVSFAIGTFERLGRFWEDLGRIIADDTFSLLFHFDISLMP